MNILCHFSVESTTTYDELINTTDFGIIAVLKLCQLHSQNHIQLVYNSFLNVIK